jgi:hypothetical protein
MIPRRSLFQALGSTIGVGLPVASAMAAQECRPAPVGPVCSSYIPMQRLGRIYAPQHMSEWCWAASISMVFAYNEHPVSQARIVQDAYGGIGNMPGNYSALFGSLDRRWTDDRGDEFTVAINNLFVPELGPTALTNADLVQELEAENPVLYCTWQHAMVLTSIRCIGPRIIEGWVMDPWPGVGLRSLTPAEMVPFPHGGQLRMAATIEIS